MSTHYSHHAFLFECSEKIVYPVIYRMVMQDAYQSLLDVSGLLSCFKIMFVNLAVIAILVRVRIAGPVSFV